MPGVWQTLSHCQLLLLLVTEQLLLEEQVSMKPWTGFSDVRVKKTSPLHYSLEQGQESFSMKGQKVSILGSAKLCYISMLAGRCQVQLLAQGVNAGHTQLAGDL